MKPHSVAETNNARARNAKLFTKDLDGDDVTLKFTEQLCLIPSDELEEMYHSVQSYGNYKHSDAS